MLPQLAGKEFTQSSGTERMSQHLPPAHERGEVTPQMTAQDRGRLPDHVAQPLMWAVGSTMKRERRARRSGACKRAARLARRRKQMSTALVMHWRSYDKVNRPVAGFHPCERFKGASSWAEVGFFDDFGFWKAEFSEVCSALCLLPETIHGKARCTASREQAPMVLLRRWRGHQAYPNAFSTLLQ